MSFIQRMAEAITDEVYKSGNGKTVTHLMLTNREKKPFSKEIDDHGGWAKGPFACNLERWIKEFIQREKAQHDAAAASLDSIEDLP